MDYVFQTLIQNYTKNEIRVENILKDPFYSLAGLRYLLPFLDRVELIPSINAKKLASPNSGSCCFQIYTPARRKHDITKKLR